MLSVVSVHPETGSLNPGLKSPGSMALRAFQKDEPTLPFILGLWSLADLPVCPKTVSVSWVGDTGIILVVAVAGKPH